jgi:hypothetical protein
MGGPFRRIWALTFVAATATRTFANLETPARFALCILKAFAPNPMHLAQHGKASNEYKKQRYYLKDHTLQPKLRKGGTFFN